ncbi:MAG: amino acid adenylation domain-containing protein [Cyanobacteria bacterium P01_F01_bin.13]
MVLGDRSNSLSQQIDTLASQSNLTTGQLLLWLGQKLNPDVPLYNMVFSFTIQGELDPEHFQRAFQALVSGSDILRLTITESAGIPQQHVAPTLDYRLPLIDFSIEVDPHQAAQVWMHQRSKRLLNLQECLFDSALLTLASDRFIWYFNQHHLITDNWSVSLLYRQLQQYYGQSLNGDLIAASELPAYLDYARLEQQQSQQQAIAHWQQKQQNMPLPISLYGHSAELLSSHTERTYFKLDQRRSEALRTLAKTPEARTLSIHQSQFNLFLTLVFAYLYRVSGSSKLAIAAPAHNRPTPALKETPGVFMELFPLHVEIEPEETFTSLLGKVTKESMAFLRYARSGVSHHGIDRNVNVVLSYINVTFPAFHDLPVQTDWIHSGYGDPQHHLRLEVHDFNATGNFTLQFDFNCDLISAVQRQWATEHFCKLLDAWLENGQQEIEAVDILTEAEREMLFGSANDPDSSARSSFSEDEHRSIQTLVERFQQQIEFAPDQSAVVFKEKTLTYAELEAQANQLAHYLIKHGITNGKTVGLFLERSISMVVAILASLKAGAAYLPIDPAYPAERAAFMVKDGQASVLLTQQSLLETCPNGHVICLETHRDKISQESTEAPAVEINANDLAYILFTSGSTGQPKGVMVEHCNVLAMLDGFEQTAPNGPQRRGTAVCSYGFDVSVWEIFSNLCFGGTVHLVPAEVVTSHNQFAQYLISHSITSAYIPPALLPTVIQSLENVKSTVTLDRILVGVEPIQQRLLQRYRRHLPQLRIVNGYGPTETTICATFYSFEKVTDPGKITPIGKAVPGYEVYLINSQGQEVPVGVKGEILIGGAGLSRGYLNRPELMAERFIDNPFGAGKLYKTGDQARYLPDGNLEFLGRLDHQVKIRGFRVELSEVETALNLHPDIQQAVVIAQKTEQGNQTLLAYLVLSVPSLTSGEVRESLQQTIPDYMLPGAFVVLDTLPLTSNGKVDRQRLSSDEYTQRKRLGTESDYVTPQGEWEIYLATLWAKCLRVESVGIHDNFFDLGGDSITAIQIAAQATESGLSLSPQHILQHLTVSRVLAQVNGLETHRYEQFDTEGSIPQTPVQHAFFEQNLAEPHYWNQSLLLEVSQPLDPTILDRSLQQLVQQHPVLALQFTRDESGWQQQYSRSMPDSLLQCVDLSSQSIADQNQAMVNAEAGLQAGLDLATGKLLQATLFNLGENRPNRLLLIIHHLVVDGVSWLTVLNDLETFYRQVQGETVSRPLPTTSFQNWSVGLLEAVSTGGFISELDYWLKLAQVPIHILSKDGANAAENTVVSTQTITTCLDVEETRKLLKDMPKVARAQVNEILLTALALTVSDKTGQASLLLDLEGHGREEAIVPGTNLVRTVGWFTTVFPLLLTLPQANSEANSEANIREQLQAVKAQVRAVPKNGIGYGLLRYLSEDSAIRSQLQAMPQSEILFNYLGDLAGLVPADSMFQMVRELRLSRSPKGQRRYLLEVNAAVVQGQLQVEWSYSQRGHHRETVQGWADEFMQGVRSQLTHYLSSDAQQESSFTAVDFPLANLNDEKLGKIAALLNKANGGG